MKTDLDLRELDELRRTLAAMEEQAPLSPDLDVVRMAPTRSVRRPAVGLVTAAVVVAVLVGLPMLLIRTGSSDVAGAGSPATIDWDILISLAAPADANSLVIAVEAIDGVAEVQYVPDVSEYRSAESVGLAAPQTEDTVAPEGTVAPGGADPVATYAAMYLRLVPDADPGAVAQALDAPLTELSLDEAPHVEVSPEIAVGRLDAWFDFAADGARVVGGDPVLLQPAAGPEPQFDTSALGELVELEGLGSADDLAPASGDQGDGLLDPGPFEPARERPVVHIGALAGADARLVVYGSDDDVQRSGHRGAQCELVVVGDHRYQAGCRLDTSVGFGVSGSGRSADDDTGIGFITVRVPAEAAAVVVVPDGGSPQWQRPIAGWALFVGEEWDYDTTTAVSVTAYDTAGDVIGEWDRPAAWWMLPAP